MKKLILVRHGATLWNSDGIFTGHNDIPLSQEGRKATESCAQLLTQETIDITFTSQLYRTIETAMILLTTGQPQAYPVLKHQHGLLADHFHIASPQVQEKIIEVHPHELLNERYYGDVQGAYKDEVKSTDPELFTTWHRGIHQAPPGGEALQHTVNRTKEFLTLLEKEYSAYTTILICAHGNSLRALIGTLEQLDEQTLSTLEIPHTTPLIYTKDANGYTTQHSLTR